MAILLGIKPDRTTGGFHGLDGFQTINVDADKIIIIAEGTREELKEKYRDIFEKCKNYYTDIIGLEIKSEDPYFDDYYEESSLLHKKYEDVLPYVNCSSILLLDGDVLPFNFKN